MDSCRVHNETPALKNTLGEINTEVSCFPPSDTTVVKHLDQKVLCEFKRTWRYNWDLEEYRVDQTNEFTSTGRIHNYGKVLMLNMVREVRDELSSREIDGIGYVRREMIQTVISPDIDRELKISQLSSG